MSYLSKNLLPNETIRHQSRVSLWSLWHLIFFGVVTLPLAGFGLVFFVAVWIIYASTELAITDKRIVAKYGFIMRDTVELPVKRVESVQVQQGILGRLFNFGTVIVAGAGNPQAKIKNVRDPLAFREVFNRMTMGEV
jgi:uncharacterized membrane protein YdbT with pleckstrin-like domain